MPENMPSNSSSLTQSGGKKCATYVGRVVTDKVVNSRFINVFIKDLLPFYNGELKEKEKDVSTGNKIRNYYKDVEWEGEPNRRFPPDVKNGEQVLVTIYVDQDKAYWRSMGRDDNLRRTEKVELSAADTPEPDDVHRENSYTMGMDTEKEKTIYLQTSKTDKEEYTYTVKLDAKNSQVIISDDGENFIKIESKIPKITLKNRDGAMIELAQKKVTIIAPEDVMIKAGKSLTIDSPLLYGRVSQGAGVAILEYKEACFKGNSTILNSGCIGLKGAVEATNIVSGPHIATSYSTTSSAPSIGMAASLSKGGMAFLGGHTGPSNAAGSVALSAATLPQNSEISVPEITTPALNDGGSSIVGGATSGGGANTASYGAPVVNMVTGTAERANNKPNVVGGSGMNRHCTAWEQVAPAILRICDELEKCNANWPFGCVTMDIRQYATECRMTFNTGE